MTLEFSVTYDDTPFVLDEAQSVGLNYEGAAPVFVPESKAPMKAYQPLADLIDEIERMMPLKYVNDVYQSRFVESSKLFDVAQLERVGSPVDLDVCLYDYIYPPSARRFSIFRGLMTSSCVKSVVASTDGGRTAKTFKMRMRPSTPRVARGASLATYTVETELFMIPPRCVGETAGGVDGLYLVTLVDERYHWQDSSVTLHNTQFTTWSELITLIARKLGVSITHSTIEAVYGQPELDSQLWANEESTPILLDAVAYNVGRVVVREYDGTYSLLTPSQCNARVTTNRGPQRYVERTAGGDIYQSGGSLPVGTLGRVRNSILPASVDVTFPKYVEGDDPVPHFLNPRYAPQRPSAWVEDSYGDVHVKTVNVSQLSGITGVTGFSGNVSFTTTAKALYATESAARSGGAPTNASGLDAVALQFASDYYGFRAFKALDETYPGIVKWQPDGIHDVIFTYSARRKGAFTRVAKTEWNQIVSHFQTSTPPSEAGRTPVPKGVGGKSVALTVRDSVASGGVAAVQSGLLSGVAGVIRPNDPSRFPEEGYWRATMDDEAMYLLTQSGDISVVYRGIDGTKVADHDPGTLLRQTVPNTTYGTNLLTAKGALAVYPGVWTSGGIQEASLDVRPGGITNIYLGSGAVGSGAIGSGAIQSGDLSIINWFITITSGGSIDYPPYYFSGFPVSGLLSGITVPKFVITHDHDIYLRGIVNGREGQIVYLLNMGAGKVTLADLAAGDASFVLPVALTPVATSGYSSGYVVWPRNGVTLEYVSGAWRFDHPTFAGGDYGSPGFAGLGPPVTYALQHLRFGSGLGYVDNNDGSANVYVLSGVGGGSTGVGISGKIEALTSDYDIATNATWENTGLTIVLPQSGRSYLVTSDVTAVMNLATTGGGTIYARIISSGGAQLMGNVAAQQSLAAGQITDTTTMQTIHLSSLQDELLVLQAARASGSDYLTARILANGTSDLSSFPTVARTTISWLKLN